MAGREKLTIQYRALDLERTDLPTECDHESTGSTAATGNPRPEHQPWPTIMTSPSTFQ